MILSNQQTQNLTKLLSVLTFSEIIANDHKKKNIPLGSNFGNSIPGSQKQNIFLTISKYQKDLNELKYLRIIVLNSYIMIYNTPVIQKWQMFGHSST